MSMNGHGPPPWERNRVGIGSVIAASSGLTGRVETRAGATPGKPRRSVEKSSWNLPPPPAVRHRRPDNCREGPAVYPVIYAVGLVVIVLAILSLAGVI
jgi:hypothetical protein